MKFDDRQDLLIVKSMVKDISTDIKTLERHDIRNTYNNSWAIRNNVDSLVEYKKELQSNLETINNNINKTSEVQYENDTKIYHLLQEINNKLTTPNNNQVKEIVKEKLYQLGQDDSPEDFRRKMNELEILIDNI